MKDGSKSGIMVVWTDGWMEPWMEAVIENKNLFLTDLLS
jgi:hypothetical protein